jgi:GT2 family glycosyltransferase
MFQNDYIENLDLDNFIVKKVNLMKVSIKPNASVIIVTYNNSDLLLLNLDNLNKQIVSDFEIIIIDNNEKIDIFPLIKKYPINYIKLKKNYGLSFARNIGIKLARGEIVIFLDDDAIPAPDFVEKHINAYKEYNIYGLRGKAIPRTSSSNTMLYKFRR